ncbi:keratin, type I cytoskeletal 19-like [Dendropsophus ebraccatus]|uniref:keratin, type I cytoskeletal 19-like n=1 Tax=Dendropsophus ebraccatus TaxID=150705 RepID=UPI0038312053
MGYRIVQPSFGTKSGEEHVTYPKYRPHHSLHYDQHSNKPENNVLQHGAQNLMNQGAFGNAKFSFSSHGRPMGSKYAVYRCHTSSFAGYSTSKKNELLDIDEKRTMQSLNGRLASYMENVKLLEEENAQLEKKIYDWYEKNEGFVLPDCSQYFNIITDLQNQVLSARTQNADRSQKIEDCHVTADGYRKNHEKELLMKTKAEEELSKHYRILENLNEESQSIDLHIKNLEEELLHQKKTSEETRGGRSTLRSMTNSCLTLLMLQQHGADIGHCARARFRLHECPQLLQHAPVPVSSAEDIIMGIVDPSPYGRSNYYYSLMALQEISSLQAQLGTRVDVEVETAPSIDLKTTLSEIRNEYETLMERNLHEVETMYHKMISDLSQEVSSGVEKLQLSNNEVAGLKLSILTLETDLKKEQNLIRAYECTLAEIQDHYRSDLSHLQSLIDVNESHLSDIQSKLKQLNCEYNFYMDLRATLEKEIDTYKYLMERQDALNSSLEMTEVNVHFWCKWDEDTSRTHIG